MLNTLAIADILREAGRFSDLTCLLSDIIDTVPATFMQSGVYIESGDISCWIDGQDVRKEAYLLRKRLLDGKDWTLKESDFQNLHRYVTDHVEVLMHNYAITVSHRIETEFDDQIRVWLILSNMLVNLSFDKWEIPKGWRSER